MDGRIVEISLPNGTTALVRAVEMDGSGAIKTGIKDKFDFGEIGATLEGLSDGVMSALRKAAPNKIMVEVAIEFAVKAGKLTALVVEGDGKGALKIRMEWARE